VRFASSSMALNLETEPLFDNMYICDFCNRIYHWVCLKNTGCYAERHREKVDETDNCACPACADLTMEQKWKRSYELFAEELNEVIWKPTWELVQTKKTNGLHSTNAPWNLRHLGMNLTSLCPQLTDYHSHDEEPRAIWLCQRNHLQHLEIQTWHSAQTKFMALFCSSSLTILKNGSPLKNMQNFQNIGIIVCQNDQRLKLDDIQGKLTHPLWIIQMVAFYS